MALDPQGYVASLQSNIRSRPIPWEGAVRAKTITEDANKKIKAIDKVRKDQRKQVLDADPAAYVSLFIGDEKDQNVFQAVAKRQDILLYLLVLFEDSIQDSPSLLSTLLKQPNPYAPFIPLLKQMSSPDDSLPLLAALVLTKLLAEAVTTTSKPNEKQSSAVSSLYTYLSALSKSSDPGHQDIAVQSYSAVLRTKKTRELFWDARKETLDPLIDILEAGSGTGKDNASTIWSDVDSAARSTVESGIAGGVGIQLIYRVLLVIWQLSFEGELVGEGLQDEHDILILYVQLLRVSPKEKISRLIMSTLSNLLTTNRSTLLPAATLARLPTLLGNIKKKHPSDPDLVEDLNSLIELLDEYTAGQTTFDEYAAEVRTGHLRWSPPHRNTVFWAENARRIFEENKGELPKALAAIMFKEWETDKQVLAIACNDVACLVKEVPEKRPVLEKLGLKTRVMELMQDPNEHVRWESLRAVGEWLRYSFNK